MQEKVVVCQIYGRKKHSATKCYFHYDSNDEKAPQAFAAMNLEEKDPQIYTDLGATSDMMNDTSNLDKIIPYKGNDKIFREWT